ncbi:hypothetical protein [Streptomyces sp. NPDC020965]|uniref:hypothetical protein n=1 Tax=Streptomyces sp. NPDC020965 TaxID=3365105 RepID=UPI0037A662E5
MKVKLTLTVLGATALASVLPVASAAADETNHNSHNGHRVSLIQMGQVDDPMEDVLEHAAVLGTTYVYD